MKLKILVVDDDRQTAETICDLLREDGHVCVPVISTEEALRTGRADGFSLALIDVNLGAGIDGISLARILRSRSGIPTLFTSGSSSPAIQMLTREVGVGFVLKPLTRFALKTALDGASAQLTRAIH
ncbi:MAG: response regulator receiver protein [Rhodospirillales bacterium]|nr:response regulator receiver protein [Rhodospirillales bacterium]